jgi:hypothetical protein
MPGTPPLIPGNTAARNLGMPHAPRYYECAGVLWRVVETTDADGSRSLIFSSDQAMRRVRTYPGGWRELSDEELRHLSWMR